MKKCHYKVLGVSSSANAEDIKAKYRLAVLKYHPDVNSSEESKILFAEIQESYEVLGNEVSRTAYDKQIYVNKVSRSNGTQETPLRQSPEFKEDWWKNSGLNEYLKAQFDARNLKNRQYMEAQSTTYRWPTGESFEDLSEAQRYFYHRMTTKRKYSTLRILSLSRSVLL